VRERLGRRGAAHRRRAGVVSPRDPRLVPEGIAWDAARKRFLVGSIAQRKIVAVDRRGKTVTFTRPEDSLDSVLGLAVGRAPPPALRVSTNGFEDSARDDRRNAI
jgi:sugar lactone lactonase YvrE